MTDGRADRSSAAEAFQVSRPENGREPSIEKGDIGIEKSGINPLTVPG